MPLIDVHGRSIDYLRISVTDRCNLRCTYCMPEQGVELCPHSSILRYEEIATIVREAVALGIRRVRLTGGEPLVRRGVVDLVAQLAGISGLEDLSMTTNGVLLPHYARDLAAAGLGRVNISLDTLQAKRYGEVSRLGRLEDALLGIQAACDAGLAPVKINVVVLRGVNDDEVQAFAEKTVREGWDVRFIELMPVGRDHHPDGVWHAQMVPAAEVQRVIEARFGQLRSAETCSGAGPARYYRLPGARGTVGFISPMSHGFCETCNRMRLTADGHLRPCLLANLEVDLRSPLREGEGPDVLRWLFEKAAACKPLRNPLTASLEPGNRAMSQIGG